MKRVQAVTHLETFRSGATEPAVFRCEVVDPPDTEDTGDYVVKFRGGAMGSPERLAREWIAWKLAAALDIPVPGAALVELSPELADAMPDPKLADRIRASSGWNFGSSYLGRGYSEWPTQRTVGQNLRGVASRMLAFDAVIDNADRSIAPPCKPNVLVRGDSVFAIDHEKAFAFVLLVGAPEHPINAESVCQIVKSHPMAIGLRARHLELGDFTARLSRLGDDVIENICDEAEAVFPHGHKERICRWLAGAREHASLLPTILGGCLP